MYVPRSHFGRRTPIAYNPLFACESGNVYLLIPTMGSGASLAKHPYADEAAALADGKTSEEIELYKAQFAEAIRSRVVPSISASVKDSSIMSRRAASKQSCGSEGYTSPFACHEEMVGA